jgi:hypothetical protein
MMAGLIDPGSIEFDAVLQGDSGGTWVDVPFDLKPTYGKGNLVPIVATFDGTVPYQGVLAMMGGARPMLLVRGDVRAKLGEPLPGDSIHVRLELDSAPRLVSLPEDVSALVEENPDAAATWESLSPSSRKEYATWIEEAKRPETRQRRVEETMARLARGEKLRS